MVRAPCCEKMGLKKGPWTPEEDHILVSYIQQHGHGNWRALPKQAGLLRCGKSCRLRWTNYLRPDIKRGNFSKEEEETIIKLHEMLGNRWSVIAARLPGRTDNEIKNVWHTHLKKRLKPYQPPKPHYFEISKYEVNIEGESNSNSNSRSERESKLMNIPTSKGFENLGYVPASPQQSYSDSSVVTGENHEISIKDEYIGSSNNFQNFEENLWSQALPMEDFSMPEDFPSSVTDPRLQLSFSPNSKNYYGQNIDESMNFWYNVFMETGELLELPEF